MYKFSYSRDKGQNMLEIDICFFFFFKTTLILNRCAHRQQSQPLKHGREQVCRKTLFIKIGLLFLSHVINVNAVRHTNNTLF